MGIKIIPPFITRIFQLSLFAFYLIYTGNKSKPVAAWAKINHFPVCFHARGQKPGTFHYLGDGRLVGAMKLVYQRGFVRCARKRVHNSRWGCYHHAESLKHPLNVLVTDADNNVVYPSEKYIQNTGMWYYLPFTDAKFSKELVFTDYANPFYLANHTHIRIWYGEDMMQYKNCDNFGRVCVEVWAHLT